MYVYLKLNLQQRSREDLCGLCSCVLTSSKSSMLEIALRSSSDRGISSTSAPGHQSAIVSMTVPMAMLLTLSSHWAVSTGEEGVMLAPEYRRGAPTP